MITLSLLTSFARAADLPQTADQVAMGRTGIAAEQDNAAISLNPGLLGLTARYDFEGLFGYGPTGGLTWGASAMDARTSDALAGGVFYSGGSADPPLTENELPGWAIPGEDIPNHHESQDFGVGLARPFLDRKLSLGVGALVGYYDQDRLGDGWRFDATAGVGLAPTENVTIGLMARGFVPWPEQDVPFSTGAGVRLHTKTTAFEADTTWFPSVEEGLPLTTSAGLEQGVGAGRLRAGWQYDAPTAVHALSLGLGLVGQSAALEYSAWIPLTGGLDLDTTVHTISVRFSASPEIKPE